MIWRLQHPILYQPRRRRRLRRRRLPSMGRLLKSYQYVLKIIQVTKSILIVCT